jgi:hypothetical protein
MKMVVHPSGNRRWPAGKSNVTFLFARRCDQPAIDPLKLHGPETSVRQIG